jgi:hypothetical protein
MDGSSCTAYATAAVARRCLRLLLREQSSRLALLETAALEPLTHAARAHAARLLAPTDAFTVGGLYKLHFSSHPWLDSAAWFRFQPLNV